MEHPANSYQDTDFIVPADNKTPADIKLTFLYTDDIKDGGQLVDHLNARVHPDYRGRGLVRPYNAGMSRQYRSHVMALFRAGVIRVLVCTDAAGMVRKFYIIFHNLIVVISRVATFLTLSSWSSGRYLKIFRLGFNAPVALLAVWVYREWLCC
jgi:hypothetical protein